jgi:hypothetical protein
VSPARLVVSGSIAPAPPSLSGDDGPVRMEVNNKPAAHLLPPPQVVLPSVAAQLGTDTGLDVLDVPEDTPLSEAALSMLVHMGIAKVPPLAGLLPLCARPDEAGYCALRFLLRHTRTNYQPSEIADSTVAFLTCIAPAYDPADPRPLPPPGAGSCVWLGPGWARAGHVGTWALARYWVGQTWTRWTRLVHTFNQAFHHTISLLLAPSGQAGDREGTHGSTPPYFSLALSPLTQGTCWYKHVQTGNSFTPTVVTTITPGHP